MTSIPPLGQLLQSFFVEHLITVKGLRPASVRSYRDTVRLLLVFAAADKGCKITRLSTGDLTFDRVVGFLRHLEEDRGNHTRTRNQRLAAVHTLFDYIATRDPEMLGVCQRVSAIPMKRAAPAETRFLERDEIEDLLRHLPAEGRLALRDRALLLFLYNTGARAQEVADLRIETTSTSVHTHWCACTAKATSGEPARYGTRRHGCCTTCWTRQRHRRRRSRRYSPPEGGPSPDLASTRSCDDTHPPSTTPTSTAGSARTRFDIAALFTCSRPASRSTSSEAGSVTPTCPRPTATPRSTPKPNWQPYEPASRPLLRWETAARRSGDPTRASCTGSIPSDRYVPELNPTPKRQ